MSAMTAKRFEAVVLQRKTPKQERARVTRVLIFEAAARIIEEQGAHALNTNAIAARAGISIGTLYGHFASKEAILISMARSQLERDGAAVLQAVGKEVGPGISRARLAVRALIDVHRTRPDVRRVVMAAHAAHGLGPERAAFVSRVALQIAATRTLAGRPRADEAVLFVTTRAVAGIVRAAFEETSPLLGTQEFENELTNMVERSFAPAGR